MHPADITAALKKAGSSQSAVARLVVGRNGKGVTPGAVHLVVQGASKSQAIASAISRITGLPVGALWPGKYPRLEKLDQLLKAAAEMESRAAKTAPRAQHPRGPAAQPRKHKAAA
jgi:lambda repressor-like predicted transcriptional regulator